MKGISSQFLSGFRAVLLLQAVFLILPVAVVKAQRIEKVVSRLEVAFITGDYKKINSGYKELQSRVKGRQLDVQDSIRYLYASARFSRIRGNFSASEDQAAACLEKAAARLGENSETYLECLLKKAVISLEAGDFIPCRQALDRFFILNRTFAAADSDLVFQARFIQTKNALEAGNIAEAGELVDKLVFKAENRLLEKKEEVNRRGKSRFISLSDDDRERRMHDLLHSRVLKARYLRERGDYREAGEELKVLSSFVKKNEIRSEDQASMEFQFEYARFFQATGRLPEAIEMLKEALSWFSRREYDYTYTKTHEQYLHMLETLISCFVEAKDLNRAWDYTRDYRELIEARYPESPAYAVRIKIPLDKEWDLRNEDLLYKLEKVLREVQEFHLPYRYASRIFTYLKDANLARDSVKKAESFIFRQVENIRLRLGRNSVHFHSRNCELAEFYSLYANKVELAGPLFEESLHHGLVPQLSELSTEVLQAWNREGQYYELKDQFQKALNNYVHVLQVLERKFGKKSLEVAVQKTRMAGAELEMGEFPAAESRYNEALENISFQRLDDSQERKDCQRSLARLYIITGRYEEAERFLSRAGRDNQYKKQQLPRTLQLMDEEIMLLLHKGLFSEAQEKAEELIELRSRRLRTQNHRSLILPFQIAAQVYAAAGHYGKAVQMATRACEVSKAVFGDSSMHYFRSLGIYSRIHSGFGDYDRALSLARQSMSGIARFYGDEHVEMAGPLTDIAMVLLYKGAGKGEVIDLLVQARDIVKKGYGNQHPRYAEALQFLASFYIQAGKPMDALPYLDLADLIWKDKLGKENIHSAEILLLRSDIDRGSGRLAEARNSLKKAAGIYRNLFDDIHPSYVAILPRISQTYFQESNYPEALETARLANRQSLSYVQKFFPSMADREKTRIWNILKPGFEYFQTLVLLNHKEKPELLAELYDLVLQTKGILLSSSIRVRERILASGNNELIASYLAWIRKKEQLSAAVEMAQQERRESGIDIRKLESEAEQLEAGLGKLSADFRQSREESNLTWKSVKEALRPREIAVEMLRFRLFANTFSDSVLYMALVINPKEKDGPKAVVFANGSKMEGRFKRYYRNSVRMAMADEQSYGVYWQPLRSLIPDGSRVFFSPDGVYNEINPEGLQAPDGSFVFDQVQFTLLSCTREIPGDGRLKSRPSGQKNMALLLGDPIYYARNDIPSDSRLIQDLPGTRKEVEKVAELLRAGRWDVETHTGKEASEALIKSVRSPRILHIATHGFFTELPRAWFKETASSILSRNQAIDNPLLRSGLYFYDAGPAVEQTAAGQEVQLGEGILTAMEAMNLDLNGTELVALSACETGRGEVQAGEGVFGLQRSFQLAGAKAMLMSLFKVSDDITQELMGLFYQNWIGRGLELRSAFNQAKMELKKKHPEPLYWASFVLVGG